MVQFCLFIYSLWCGGLWLGLDIFHASSWIETKEVMAGVGFFAFAFLVQYENEASGSLGSRRKMEESGGSMDIKKIQGTYSPASSCQGYGCLGLTVSESSTSFHMTKLGPRNQSLVA